MFSRVRLRDFDFKLFAMVIMLAVIGIITVGSAEPSLQKKQFYGVLGGIAVLLILTVMNYSWILKFYWLMYIANLGLLVAVQLFGDKGGGAQRWLEIGPLRFQPSETAKILLILFFAQFIMKYRERLNTMYVIGACLVFILIPWVLIFKQPDLSTSLVVIALFAVIMFAGGVSWKIIIGVLAVMVPAVAIVIALALQPDSNLLGDYQVNRILAFRDPEAYANEEAYQQLNSVTAIASGQLDGKGYKNNEISSVKNGNFLSEAQTDFIFAVIGEEFGFKGSLAVIVLEIMVALNCISIARRAKDLAGTIIASGMGGLVAFQSFFNIGVATFLLPNTGLPLPFVSYGLTSVMSLFIGMGFVMNVRMQAGKDNTREGRIL